MATTNTKGQAIAAPQIFNSDPLEQTYAKEMFSSPDLGGTAYAMLQGAKGDRAGAQATYLDALREANTMSMRMAAQESQADILKELIKSAAEQANAGIDPSTMIQSGMLYKNPGDPNTVAPSSLSRDLKRADAENKRASAAKAGKEGGPQFKMTTDLGPGNTPGDSRLEVKGADAARVQQIMKERVQAASGTGTTTPPGTMNAREAFLLQQRLNNKDKLYQQGN